MDGADPSELIPDFETEIEAEKMNLSGYAYESNSAASGGGCVSANSSGAGTARARFTGASGRYVLKVSYFDENDGAAVFKLYVNNELKGEWTADSDLGSASADSLTLTTYTAVLELTQGDIIEIEGRKNNYDSARLDKLELEMISDIEISEPVASDGRVTVGIKNNANETKTAALILAGYENDTLKDITIDEQDLVPDSVTELSADIPETEVYRMFIWDGLGSMRPLYIQRFTDLV